MNHSYQAQLELYSTIPAVYISQFKNNLSRDTHYFIPIMYQDRLEALGYKLIEESLIKIARYTYSQEILFSGLDSGETCIYYIHLIDHKFVDFIRDVRKESANIYCNYLLLPDDLINRLCEFTIEKFDVYDGQIRWTAVLSEHYNKTLPKLIKYLKNYNKGMVE